MTSLQAVSRVHACNPDFYIPLDAIKPSVGISASVRYDLSSRSSSSSFYLPIAVSFIAQLIHVYFTDVLTLISDFSRRALM